MFKIARMATQLLHAREDMLDYRTTKLVLEKKNLDANGTQKDLE